MGTMMALRARARGGPEQLVYEQAPAPSAGPGGALIAVHAAAITFAELTWDLEWTTRDGADRTPVIPSHEMSDQELAGRYKVHAMSSSSRTPASHRFPRATRRPGGDRCRASGGCHVR